MTCCCSSRTWRSRAAVAWWTGKPFPAAEVKAIPRPVEVKARRMEKKNPCVNMILYCEWHNRGMAVLVGVMSNGEDGNSQENADRF